MRCYMPQERSPRHVPKPYIRTIKAASRLSTSAGALDIDIPDRLRIPLMPYANYASCERHAGANAAIVDGMPGATAARRVEDHGEPTD